MSQFYQEAEVKRFCKDARNLKVQRGSEMGEEWSQGAEGAWSDILLKASVFSHLK